jgi:polyhydroxyalkanoate synthesis regulator phasin
MDELFNKLKMDSSEVEMIKFENKLENLSQPDDTRLLDNEHNFIRKKIDEVRGELNQLENNLQFFSNIDEDNPLVKDVLNNIENHKENLNVWEEKLKKLRDMY